MSGKDEVGYFVTILFETSSFASTQFTQKLEMYKSDDQARSGSDEMMTGRSGGNTFQNGWEQRPRAAFNVFNAPNWCF